MTFSTRPYQPSDAATLCGMVQQLQTDEAQLHPSRKTFTEQESANYVEQLLADIQAKQGMIYLAEQSAKPVGFTAGWIEVEDDPIVFSNYQRYGYVCDTVVLPNFRRQGVASALNAAMEDYFLGQQCTLVRRTALATNKPRRAGLEKLGYNAYEITYEKHIA